MKKLVYSVIAIAAVFATSSCDQSRLDIPQKGVTAYESFYQTDEDCEAALTAAYASFATNVAGRGNQYIYTPIKAMLNNCGDDMFAAGSNFGDNDFMAALNEFRYDSGDQSVKDFYKGLFKANYTSNLVIENFKDGLPNGGQTATTKRCVAEARVLRALYYFYLTALWDTPPFIDHVISDALPYNCDADPENPMSHEELMRWVASECEAALPDLEERKSPSDKAGAVKVTKGFANALAGKAYIFVKDYAKAKTALGNVIKSGKYELVPGADYWQNFHIQGDGNSEKVFESNIAYTTSQSMSSRSTWMESQIWNWRSDHFVKGAAPNTIYTGGVEGWGGLGVPQWFGDEFLANDGHSYRFDATLIHIADAVYNTQYGDNVVEVDKTGKVIEGGRKINDLSLDEKKASKAIGIQDPLEGLYGQSFWLPLKQMMKEGDSNKPGDNTRLNNNIIMRYAEVLLLYAEACLQTGDQAEALKYINEIQKRAGSKTISSSVDMNVLKKEKSYELWLEGSRFLDLVRWGDTSRLEQAGQDVPKLFDKLFRTPEAGDENVKWENGTEANSRFYTVKTHTAKDRGFNIGYKAGKHDKFPFPMEVIEKNPNIRQNPGWE